MDDEDALNVISCAISEWNQLQQETLSNGLIRDTTHDRNSRTNSI